MADALQAAGTGLFRVMDAPEGKALRRLRHTAQAFGLQWPTETSLDAFGRTLDPTQPSDAAFMMAVRRAGGGASYVPYREGVRPWHAAMAATYAHATAPLRRLADRYVVQAALAVANALLLERLDEARQAAEELGLSRSAFYRRLEKYGL